MKVKEGRVTSEMMRRVPLKMQKNTDKYWVSVKKKIDTEPLNCYNNTVCAAHACYFVD